MAQDSSLQKKIISFLFDHQDLSYRDFQGPLIPNLKNHTMIGVRTPVLRALAKTLVKEESETALDEYTASLPHQYFEENQLHAFIISLTKDFEKCLSQVDAFLPFVDNWATCDQLSPQVFKKSAGALLPSINVWLLSNEVYRIRFAIGCLMRYFLDENFEAAYLDLVASVENGDYYVKMMQAWYYATALAKQWDETYSFLKKGKLELWTIKKTIQKARESYRVSEEHKVELSRIVI